MKKLLCVLCLLVGVLFFNSAEARYYGPYVARHYSYARHYHRPIHHYHYRPVRHYVHHWHRYW